MFGRKPFSWRLLLLRNRDCHFHGVDFATTPTFPSEWPFGEDKSEGETKSERSRGVLFQSASNG